MPKLLENLNNFRVKHEPEILMGMGIAGLLVSTGLAIRATIKATKVCEKKKFEENKNKLTFKEVFKSTWKFYVPTAVGIIVSVPCIIAGNRVSTKRTAVMAAAYTLSKSALDEYQAKTKELVGEKKEQEIREEVVKEKAKQIESKEIILSGDDDLQLFLEPITGRYFKSTWNAIKEACNDLNERALGSSTGWYSLDDWFYKLGLESTMAGQLLGWGTPFYGNSAGLMKIHMTTAKTKDNRACGAICYDVEPYSLGK